MYLKALDFWLGAFPGRLNQIDCFEGEGQVTTMRRIMAMTVDGIVVTNY